MTKMLAVALLGLAAPVFMSSPLSATDVQEAGVVGQPTVSSTR